MAGGAAVGTARVRIKGRKLSVIRFLILSIAYTTPWIIMLSQLAYYSKIYGPQVLLQLNIAYYLPSIPILLLAGHVEKLLDEQFGSTASMAIRLTAGLSGCAAIAASYPFIPPRLNYLLWVVVALGSISAVAFSTSYQLVAWFRSADTIALGIGCVASGPLALVIQLALHIGTTPKRWQWIGLFEAAAGLVLVGLLAGLSLFWQYWGILSATETYDDRSMPLLDAAEQAQQEHADHEAGEQALMLSRMLTMQDPFQGFPYTTTPGLAYPHLQPLIRRAASDDLSGFRRQNHRAQAAHTLNRHHTAVHRTPAQRAAAAAASGPSLLMRKNAASNVTHQQQQQQEGAAGGPDGHLLSESRAAAAAAVAAAGQQPAVGCWSRSGWEHYGSAPIIAGSIASSIHSSSRPASPSPIPGAAAGAAAAGSSARLASSVMDDLPDLEDVLLDRLQQQQQRRHLAKSAPQNTTPSLLGSDEEEELSRLAAAGAAPPPPPRDADFLLAAGDIGSASPAHSHRSSRAAAAAADGSSDLRWTRSRSPSASPACTPRSFDAAAAAAANRGSKRDLQLFFQQQQQQQQQHMPAAKPPLPATAYGQQQQQQMDLQQLLQQPRHKRNISSGSACSAFSAASVQSGAGFDQASNAEKGFGFTGSTGDLNAAAGGSEVASSVKGEEAESLSRVYMEVFSYTWMVVLAALISSTLLNCIFPFFTYVESSGMLGEFLPQVLFYTRMLSDIVGRMVPRKKVLAITSPVALLCLSGGLLLAAGCFFAYLQVPPHMQYDPYVMVMVLLIWLGGGYINTMSYILAPALVPPRVCTKASAVMALTYQIAHIMGLMLAIMIAVWLYGDISGNL